VPEVLVEFDEPIIDAGGTAYVARVWGAEDDIGRWIGWLEFAALGGAEDRRLWSDRETVQPNRRDLEYWVTGLSRVYLEGALARARDTVDDALRPPFLPMHPIPRVALSDRPRAILDPFATFAQSERVLRAELGALSAEHLRNIAPALATPCPAPSATRTADELREAIVAAARRRAMRQSERGLSA